MSTMEANWSASMAAGWERYVVSPLRGVEESDAMPGDLGSRTCCRYHEFMEVQGNE